MADRNACSQWRGRPSPVRDAGLIERNRDVCPRFSVR